MGIVKSLRAFIIMPESTGLVSMEKVLGVLRRWKVKHGSELRVDILEEVDDTGYSFYQSEGEIGLFVWIGETPPSARDRSRLRLIGLHQQFLLLIRKAHLKTFSATLREFNDRVICLEEFSLQTLEDKMGSLRKLAERDEIDQNLERQFTLNDFEGLLGNRFNFDLRAPLKLIADSVESLRDLRHEPRYDRSLRIVRDATGMLLYRIMELLDHGQSESKHVELQTRPFQLSSLLQSLEMVLSLKARITETEFIVVIDDAIPARIIGDPERLGQALLGLIEKFLVFTPRSGIALFVDMERSENNEPILRFAASDSGATVGSVIEHTFTSAKEVADFIFTRNGRVDSDLVFNYELLTQLGGTVSVKSSPGQGTVLKVLVPVQTFELNQLEVASGAISVAPGMTILVVDDNSVNRRVLEIALTKKGHQVLLAQNGAEAVALYEKHAIDVILMDIEMPIMDGIAASKKIREIDIVGARYTPILAVTTRRVEDVWTQCELAGMDGFVPKPIDFKQLWAGIRSAVEVSLSREEARVH